MELALALGYPLRLLGAVMDGQEFAEWYAYFQVEGRMPRSRRDRHGSLVAAVMNGPLTRPGKRLWAAADLADPDPWAALSAGAAKPETRRVSPALRMKAMHNAQKRGGK